MSELNRRDFMSLAGAFALSAAGCAHGTFSTRISRAVNRLGVCSWSYRLPLAKVAAEMAKLAVPAPKNGAPIPLRGIHLALAPFIAADARHGGAEGEKALEDVKKRLADGMWKLNATMISFKHEDYATLETIRETGGIVPDWAWDEDRETVRKAAKLTRELGAPYLTLHAGFLDESSPKALATYTDRVKTLRDICGEQGVRLLLESGQETAEDLAKFLPTVAGVGVNFDPANMILYGKGDPVAAVKILAPWIRHIHIKDARKTQKPGTWGTETPWGEGEVNPPAFFRALADVGYTGNFAVEREGGNERVRDIATAVARFRREYVD